jgi:CheY-like chemotaxis protein
MAQKSPRVLIVDDDEDCLLILGTIYRKAGADVVTASSGEEALELWDLEKEAGSTFAIVSLDVRMPHLRGPELGFLFRDRGFHGILVALTADASGGGRTESKSAGVDAYFGKNSFKAEVAKALLEQAALKQRG